MRSSYSHLHTPQRQREGREDRVEDSGYVPAKISIDSRLLYKGRDHLKARDINRGG